MKSFMPPLVLMIVCIVVSGLLAFASDLTAPKIEQAQKDKLNKSLNEVFGEADYNVLDSEYDGVTQVITDDKGRAIFDITVDGYSKGGIQALIGIDSNGQVCGISIVSISETAGLGTKVQDSKYIDKYIGLSEPEFSGDTIITGATYSSKGMQKAVTTALEIYNNNKEAILGE